MPLKRGGCKARSLNDDEINIILTWIEEKPEITLREISSKIFAEFEKQGVYFYHFKYTSRSYVFNKSSSRSAGNNEQP